MTITQQRKQTATSFAPRAIEYPPLPPTPGPEKIRTPPTGPGVHTPDEPMPAEPVMPTPPSPWEPTPVVPTPEEADPARPTPDRAPPEPLSPDTRDEP